MPSEWRLRSSTPRRRPTRPQRVSAAPRPPQPLPEGAAIERVVYRAPDGLILPPWRAEQLLRRAAPLLVALDANRVLFAPNFLIPPLFRFARGARVATVHDLSLFRLPWAVRPDARRALAAGLERTFLDADLILTLSRAVRDELVARGLSPARLRPIHLGPGQMEEGDGDEPLPDGVPERFALHVGTLEPRKNLPVLLAAWKLLNQRRSDRPPLVLCGGFGWHAEELRGLVAAGERDGSVIVTGYVEPPALRALYRRAALVAVPSLYEGFGLTVAEAMAAGVPLVVSDIPVLREVAGDAALYAPTDRADLWAARLAELLDDGTLRERLRTLGRERRKLFDWRTTAEETARAFRDAAGPA